MHCIWIDTFHCNTLFNIYICFIVIHCLYIYLIVIDCIWIYTFHCKILFIYICLIVKHCIWIERLFHWNTLFNIYICFIVIHCIWIKRLFHSNTFALIAYTTFTGFNVKDASSFPSSTPTEGYVAWNALLTRTRSNSKSAFGELLCDSKSVSALRRSAFLQRSSLRARSCGDRTKKEWCFIVCE